MVPSSLFLTTHPTIQQMRDQLGRWRQKETPIQGEDFHAYTFRMGKLKTKIMRCCLCAVAMCIPTFADMQALFTS